MADRDTKGRFAKGNKAAIGNKGGRPRRAVEERYLSVLTESISDEEWGRIVRKAVSQALQGDRYAREWLGNYLIGRPTQYENIQVDQTDPLADLLSDIQAALAGGDRDEPDDADDSDEAD